MLFRSPHNPRKVSTPAYRRWRWAIRLLLDDHEERHRSRPARLRRAKVHEIRRPADLLCAYNYTNLKVHIYERHVSIGQLAARLLTGDRYCGVEQNDGGSAAYHHSGAGVHDFRLRDPGVLGHSGEIGLLSSSGAYPVTSFQS